MTRREYKSSFCWKCAQSVAPVVRVEHHEILNKYKCTYDGCKSKSFTNGLCLFHLRITKPVPKHEENHIGSVLDKYIHLIGRVPDKHIASLAETSVYCVTMYRKRHKIARDKSVLTKCPNEYLCSYENALGILPDTIVATAFGVSQEVVRAARRCRGIPAIAKSESRYLCLNFPFDVTPKGVTQFLAEYNGHD